MVYLLVSFLFIPAIIANIFAFLSAYPVSYYGHNFFTFSEHKHQVKDSIKKFFLVALLGFCLNEGGYFILLTYTKLHYLEALIIILLLVPISTFVLAKFWAFKDQK